MSLHPLGGAQQKTTSFPNPCRRLESYAARKGLTVNVQKSYIVNFNAYPKLFATTNQCPGGVRMISSCTTTIFCVSAELMVLLLTGKNQSQADQPINLAEGPM